MSRNLKRVSMNLRWCAFASPAPRDHAPRITRARTRIVGCTCGWRAPPGTTDSDSAFIEHATVMR